ncbi:MAG TPA: hypothetical protein VM890_11585 [Longimicrobium sp.]|nr:hypothetical protein [Longimicrobium sp.]
MLPMTRVDRVLRWVWLINGVLLLALLVFGAGFVAIGALSGLGGGSPAASPSKGADSVRTAAAGGPIRYDPPIMVRGRGTRVVLVRRGTGYTYSSTASSASSGGEGAVVNVAFLEGGGARLLLDRPGFIRRVRFPGHDPAEAAGDSALRWIVYEMALQDSNADRAVDDRDRRSLYVSDLDGRGLRRVLPEGYELREWAGQPDGSLVATGLELAPAPGGMRQRAFVLDPAGVVRPYAALDSVAAEAGRIVGTP